MSGPSQTHLPGSIGTGFPALPVALPRYPTIRGISAPATVHTTFVAARTSAAARTVFLDPPPRRDMLTRAAKGRRRGSSPRAQRGLNTTSHANTRMTSAGCVDCVR
jgi:hypothetical protein